MKLTLKRTEWLISATVFFTNPWTSLERTPTTSSQDRRCPKKLTTPISRIHSFLQQCQVTAPKLRLFASGCMEWFDFLNCRQKIGARATLCNSSCVLKLKHWCVWVCVCLKCAVSPHKQTLKKTCVRWKAHLEKRQGFKDPNFFQNVSSVAGMRMPFPNYNKSTAQ